MGGNRTYSCAHNFAVDELTLAYISVPVGVCVVTQNLLSIIIIRRTPKLHTNANLVVMSIACGDIYLSLVYVVDGIFYLPGVMDPLWNTTILDACICGAGYSCLLLSVSQLGLIAVDRYIHIVHPLYYMAHITRPRVYAMIACVWFVAFLYGLIPIFVYRSASDYTRCLIVSPPTEYLAAPGVLYHVVLILICVCYFRIARLAFQRKKACQTRQMRLDGGISNRETFSTSRTAAWRSVKFFATMCGIFFVCTYPAFLSVVINVMDRLPMYVFMLLLLLFLTHSTINFCVFINMNNYFYQGFKQIFLDIHRKCMKTSNTCET